MTQGLNFACPSCGKQYPWSAELAGKKGKCKCGNVWRVPAEPPGSSSATKSAAMVARPMPRPQPVATEQHEEPEADVEETASSGSNGTNGEASTADDAKTKKSIGGALRSLWPKPKKKK